MATVWILVPLVVVVSTLVVIQAAQPNFCNLPSETGPCRAGFRRYFFDSSAQECKLFIYGGCQGNDNNFRSESQCRAACTCTQNSDSGRRCKRPARRFYYDVSDATCKRFRYNGCGGNSNRFFSARRCLDACVTSVCFLPPETGPCRAAFDRYYYNKTSQSCEVFTYGGCQGNENRFSTQEECNRKCTVPISGEEAIISRTSRDAPDPPVTNEPTGPPMSICKLPQATGPCRAAFPRYFYNSTSKSCEFFVYGGCQGNENNFATEVECQSRCISNTGDQQSNEASQGLGTLTAEDCQLPPDQGLCQAYEQAFYYNGATGKCEEFIYGGCQGNKNRFPTVQSCMKICGQFGSVVPSSSIPGGGLNSYHGAIPGGGLGDMRSVIPGGGLRTMEVKPRLCILNIFSLMADRVRAIFGLPPQTPRSPCDNYNPFPNRDLCHLPSEPGMCYGYFPKYHFNTETGKCEQFIYGGCGGNGNNFDSVSECEAQCGTVKPPSSKDQCFLPPESGMCLGYFPKYHFNATSGACEEFIYGGCGGNDNNFDSAADCEKQCGVSGPPVSNDRCLLTPETGLCKGYFPKYHFNATAGVCEEFIYGGCGGNDNRFDTAAECETKCGSAGPPVSNEQCLLPPETGLCRGYFPKYHFNVTSGACEEFIYGGCGGNNNRFDSVAECETKCGSAEPPLSNEQCLLPPETGMCRGYFPKYHFNATSGACEEFIYGGCGGNNNRFDTVAECETKCGSVGPPLSNEQCLLPPETGMCRGYFPKYHYNVTSGACEQFIYGGCGGNNNRFDTVSECETKCGSAGPPVSNEQCLLPPETGMCRGYFPKYFFNATSGACEEFIYGGCQGNDNRFDSVVECQTKCGGN